MPHQTILRLQHEMVLIRERQEPALNPPRLQDIKSSQTLRDANSVVLRVVDDELRGGPVGQVFGGVPAAPGVGGGLGEGVGWRLGFWGGGGGGGGGVFAIAWSREVRVVPRCSAEVVEGEVEFFGGEHVCAAEDAVVAD